MVRRCCCSDNIAAADASYVTTTPEAGLSNEQALSPLGTGLLKNASGTGILSIATAGIDYAAVVHSHDADDIVSGILDYDRGGVMVADGRLTLESGVPVSTSDQLAKTTLYYTPYIGERLTLYDGSKWQPYTFTEPSISLAAIANATNYDVFGYLSSGTPALELLAWASDTARATAIVRSNGVLIKSGDASRRYLGTIRGSAAGQCEDSFTGTTQPRAFVCNYYNRVFKHMARGSNAPHNYNTVYRSWNGDNTLRVEFVIGVVEESIQFNLIGEINSVVDNNVGAIGLGLNVTNARSSLPAANRSAQQSNVSVPWNMMPALGYSFVQIVEVGDAANPLFALAEVQAGFKR